jgi:hypothetical protein
VTVPSDPEGTSEESFSIKNETFLKGAMVKGGIDIQPPRVAVLLLNFKVECVSLYNSIYIEKSDIGK